ncbi:MAG: hypothetical protein K1X89_23690 [Myxococcaceae bacterium]|nr:hypothetical protein [Myxococcaceae bacterium]
MEKRRHRRYAKRFRVRYGETQLDKTGFSGDVSATGLFVMTNHQPKLGTRMHVEVGVEGDKVLYLEAVVARLAIVAPELRGVMKGGFGMRYLTGAELMAEMVPHLKDNKARLVLSYGTKEAFLAAYENELKRGGAFVFSLQEQKQDTILTLEVDCSFMGKVLAFEARVVHVAQAPDGRWGLGLMFLDPAAAMASLGAMAGLG